MIPFYSFKNIHQEIENDLINAASNIISSGNYVFGTNKFEEEFAEYVGSKYCIAVSNGTAAIHLALLSLGIKPGDEVITVSHTFRATVAAIKYCGATPVYVDIDPNTFTMDVSQIEKKITHNTKAIIPVHLYGNMVDMTALVDISTRFNIPIVEDCSQAHGTTHFKKHVGTWGKAGTFSFYPGKGLGALGDAGCIVTDDIEIYKSCCKLRTWDDNDVGYNYRMANIQAEFLRIKLRTFNAVLQEKREIAAEYNKRFDFVKTKVGVDHSYHIYPILVKNREEFINKVKPQLELKTHYPLPVHKLLAYKHPTFLPVTEKISSTQVSLPIYPGVDYKSVLQIIDDNISPFL